MASEHVYLTMDQILENQNQNQGQQGQQGKTTGPVGIPVDIPSHSQNVNIVNPLIDPNNAEEQKKWFLYQRSKRVFDQKRALEILHSNLECPGFLVQSAPWTWPNEPGTVDAFQHGRPPKRIIQDLDVMISNNPAIHSSIVKVKENEKIPLSIAIPSQTRNRKMAEKEKKENDIVVVNENGNENGNDIEETTETPDESGFVIHESLENGDCFFDSVRQALASVKKQKTIEELRHIVARTVLDPTDEFANYNLLQWKELLEMALLEKDKEMIQEFAHAKSLVDFEKLEEIEEQREREREKAKEKEKKKEKKKENKEKEKKNENEKESIHDPKPPFFTQQQRENVYQMMCSHIYWGNEYAVYVLEKVYNITFLIFKEDDGKVRCPPDHGPDFHPKYFCILVLFDSNDRPNHYQPVSYHGKFFLKLKDIPSMVVEKFQTQLPRKKGQVLPYWYQNLEE